MGEELSRRQCALSADRPLWAQWTPRSQDPTSDFISMVSVSTAGFTSAIRLGRRSRS